MADDTIISGTPDCAHELQTFADTHGLPLEQVRELAQRVGNSRSALEAAVQMLNSQARCHNRDSAAA